MAESSTLALGQLILRDDFDDNQRGSLWRLYNEDPNNCGVIETNGRFEFRSIRGAADGFAGYIANAWQLDPSEDFALRVNAHYDVKTLASGWINIGITPNAETPRSRSVELGIGCTNLLSCYWYDYTEEWPVESSRVSRLQDDAVLYISYTAEDDTLYVSDTGYGPDQAWMSFPDVLQGQWEGDPVYVYLGGRADGLAVSAGHAYLDDLLVEQGLVIEAALQEVYRFWSPVTGSHFYTISEWEKESLLVNHSDVWLYEGIAYHAYPNNADSACKPVYRFWSDTLFKHYYTISETEKESILVQYADAWTYEGIVFYVYPEGSQPEWTEPVYRFHAKNSSAYFYTMDEAEKNYVVNEYSAIWTYEGIVWYASP